MVLKIAFSESCTAVKSTKKMIFLQTKFMVSLSSAYKAINISGHNAKWEHQQKWLHCKYKFLDIGILQ